MNIRTRLRNIFYHTETMRRQILKHIKWLRHLHQPNVFTIYCFKRKKLELFTHLICVLTETSGDSIKDSITPGKR